MGERLVGSGPRALMLLLGMLGGCAAPVPAQRPRVLPAPAIDRNVQAIEVHGPASGDDLVAALEQLRGGALDAQMHTAVEGYVRDYYAWLEWREVRVIVDSQVDPSGTLHVIVSGEPPPDTDAAPAAVIAAEPAAGLPPEPPGISGARTEAALDASFGIWLQSPSRVLIDAAEKRLYFKRAPGQVVSYGVAVGTARTPTPPGDYTVEAIRAQPTWYPPPSIRREAERQGKPLPAAVPPGAHNPLGSWFVRLQNGIGIHGTNQPRSIGRAASHGCIRMHDRDVADLIRALHRGDGVTIVRARRAAITTGDTRNEVLRRMRPAGGTETAAR